MVSFGRRPKRMGIPFLMHSLAMNSASLAHSSRGRWSGTAFFSMALSSSTQVAVTVARRPVGSYCLMAGCSLRLEEPFLSTEFSSMSTGSFLLMYVKSVLFTFRESWEYLLLSKTSSSVFVGMCGSGLEPGAGNLYPSMRSMPAS